MIGTPTVGEIKRNPSAKRFCAQNGIPRATSGINVAIPARHATQVSRLLAAVRRVRSAIPAIVARMAVPIQSVNNEYQNAVLMAHEFLLAAIDRDT